MMSCKHQCGHCDQAGHNIIACEYRTLSGGRNGYKILDGKLDELKAARTAVKSKVDESFLNPARATLMAEGQAAKDERERKRAAKEAIAVADGKTLRQLEGGAEVVRKRKPNAVPTGLGEEQIKPKSRVDKWTKRRLERKGAPAPGQGSRQRARSRSPRPSKPDDGDMYRPCPEYRERGYIPTGSESRWEQEPYNDFRLSAGNGERDLFESPRSSAKRRRQQPNGTRIIPLENGKWKRDRSPDGMGWNELRDTGER
jgi:hypothetical protein